MLSFYIWSRTRDGAVNIEWKKKLETHDAPNDLYHFISRETYWEYRCTSSFNIRDGHLQLADGRFQLEMFDFFTQEVSHNYCSLPDCLRKVKGF